MKNAFLVTALAGILLVGCNEPNASPLEAVKAPQTVEEIPSLDGLMKLVECSAVSRISQQIYSLYAEGVPTERVAKVVFSDLTEDDGPIYGLLKSTVDLTANEATSALAAGGKGFDYTELSRLWSAQIFNLCTSEQL